MQPFPSLTKGMLPENLSTTAHQLEAYGELLRCAVCSAEFLPQDKANFAWALPHPANLPVCSHGPVEREYTCLSVKQPWAGMLAREEKSLEIRTWPTRYRGDVLLLASAKPDKLDWLPPVWAAHDAKLYPLGVAICLGELYDCRPMRADDEQGAQCPYESGLWAHCYRNIRPVAPLPVKGGLGLRKRRLTLPEK